MNSIIPLAGILAIGQVLFSVALAGFVFFQFERTKQMQKAEVEINSKPENQRDR
jgi:hypothetical protein